MNTAAKPLRSMDTRGGSLRTHEMRYDVLLRPVETLFVEGSTVRVVSRMEYGDDTSTPIAYGRGRVLKVYDGAGLAETKVYDFKGNALSQTRTLLEDGKLIDIDWSSGPTLQTTAYETSALFDALNRPTEQTAPDGSIQSLTYNQSGLLESLTLKHAFEPSPRTVIANIDYNEKGQRERVSYGEAAGANACCTIESTYDAKTFRLIRLITTRVSDEAKVQDLSYTYDAVGNITHIADAAQRTLFFDNAIIEPSNDYAYDSLYRLVEGSGREHVNQGDINSNRGNSTVPVPVLPEVSDETALRNYTQTYTYDDSGNLTQMKHEAGAGSWTRIYTYHPGGNRLATTQIGSGPVVSYTHDAHGNMQSLGGVGEELRWNHRDELASYFIGTGEPTYYQYDASGQRVRKYSGVSAENHSETIYLGGFEVVSNVSGGDETRLETIYVSDGQSRVCTVERKVKVDGSPSISPVNWRYQLGNHLGSASVELDEAGAVISYEEFHPYGSTSYRSHRPGGANLSRKRYRFTGKERDDESGLYYHGARYYAAWLGRWTAADPIGIGDGLNRFGYVRGNPINFNDPTGNFSAPIDTKNLNQVSNALNSAALDLAKQNPGTEVQIDVNQPKGGEITIRVRIDGIEAFNGSASEFATQREPSTRELIERSARQDASDANTERLDGSGTTFTNAGRDRALFTAGLAVMTEGGIAGQLGYLGSKAAGLSEEQSIAGGELTSNLTSFRTALAAHPRPRPNSKAGPEVSSAERFPTPEIGRITLSPGQVDVKAPSIVGTYPNSVLSPVEAGGARSHSLGLRREEFVANSIGGAVAKVGKRDLKLFTSRGEGVTVDVVGPEGQLVVVGGAAKAKKLGALGDRLRTLREMANETGVTAQAFFEEGTPESVLQLARKFLEAENVITFPKVRQ
jgi:RHS repeat-associated protein